MNLKLKSHNIEILKKILNWNNMEEISEIEIQNAAKKLQFPLGEDFLLKCSWNYYKKCTVFSLNKVPLLFFKYIREKYFLEVFGLHLAIFYFDNDLCFNNYLTGIFKKKKPIPYLITTYEMGVDIGKYKIVDYLFLLGRQCYLHEILSLYDVYERHFIVRNKDSLCRIDFGRCFENLERQYLGFHDFLKKVNINFENLEFQKGYKFEQEKISSNVKKKKDKFIEIIRSIKNLEKDYILIDFDVGRFHERLIKHWQGTGFLNNINIAPSELI